LARRAFCRARTLYAAAHDAGDTAGDADRPALLGIACTATIATNRPKRGDHRCHVATFGAGGLMHYALTFIKGARDRAGEEAIVSRLVLRATAAAAGCTDINLPIVLQPGERVEVPPDPTRRAVRQLLAGQVRSVIVDTAGVPHLAPPPPKALLPGSFNPLHDGHRRLAAVASAQLGEPVAYEISITNVDKPPLPADAVMGRLAQFACEGRPVALSRGALYSEKAARFPGCVFVIGYDTACRLFQLRYYDGSREEMYRALEAIAAQGCRFLVAGRADANGVFRTLADIDVPDRFRGLLAPIPESAFRMDISSTALRQEGETITTGGSE
jgi:hypothetical protein